MSQARAFALLCAIGLAVGGCSRPVKEGSLVLAQAPRNATAAGCRDVMDLRYPEGSRLVLAETPFNAATYRILSTGLRAAGAPVMAYDGKSVYFAGKASASSEWQVYRAQLENGRPQALTSMPGGAMDPALLPDGTLVFASPVPKLGSEVSGVEYPALFAQTPGQKPRRLTFCPGSAAEPTVLSDGRILFVYTPPAGATNASARAGLYTINNDGTELTALAGQHDRPAPIHRPRQLADGRIAFLVSDPGSARPSGTAETISLARPFRSRNRLLPEAEGQLRSVQPAGNDDLLVCGARTQGPLALFRVALNASSPGQPVLEEPAWDNLEALQVQASARPMGRLSNMSPESRVGQILCLDANDTTYRAASGTNAPVARMRVLAETKAGEVSLLGEVPVQADGSFMAEVPADVPLGFEALDDKGVVLRRVDPMIWVRAGENRSCVGCHASHNRAPHNHRPLAVRSPLPHLGGEAEKLAQGYRLTSLNGSKAAKPQERR